MKLEKIIVIGAGPSGLATALGLAERGFEVAVFDAAEIAGGLAGSEVFEGMTVDYGPHIYHTDDKETESLWRDLFGDLLEEKEFFSKNFKDGFLYDYPLSYESIERFPPDVRKKVKEELASLVVEQIFDNALATGDMLEDPREMVARSYQILEMLSKN